jgi:hypothetical protein
MDTIWKALVGATALTLAVACSSQTGENAETAAEATAANAGSAAEDTGEDFESAGKTIEDGFDDDVDHPGDEE